MELTPPAANRPPMSQIADLPRRLFRGPRRRVPNTRSIFMIGWLIHRKIDAFETHRRHLMALAYRMTGSVADAEDIVQEAYLHWERADRDSVRDPRAFLSKTVTRLGCSEAACRQLTSRARSRSIGPSSLRTLRRGAPTGRARLGRCDSAPPPTCSKRRSMVGPASTFTKAANLSGASLSISAMDGSPPCTSLEIRKSSLA